jgi:dUTP pyrophosphatase
MTSIKEHEYLNLKIKPLTNKIKELYKNHGTFHPGDSGLDLFCIEDITIEPRAYSIKVPLGICISAENFIGHVHENSIDPYRYVENKYEANNKYLYRQSSMYLYPRSSTGLKTPLRLSNSVGIIDAQYRGELCAILDNVSDKPFEMKKGERYFQLCAGDLRPIKFQLVNELDQTQRGSGGFGSTNK